MIELRPPELTLNHKLPLVEGENDRTVLEIKGRPKTIRKALYIVHPTAAPDGDFNHQAKEQIQNYIDRATEPDSLIVAILPPSESHFLRPGTQVSEATASPNENLWVSPRDIGEATETITLVGGNIERCLGATFTEIRRLTGRTGREQFILPLDAIYTDDGTSAATAFGWLLKHARSPLEAAVALLAIQHNPRYSYEYGNRLYGNHLFEIINSDGRFHYIISLNGAQLGELKPDQPKGLTILPGPDDPVIKLNLVTPTDGNKELPTNLQAAYQKRLMHARFRVLPEYGIPAPEGETEKIETSTKQPQVIVDIPASWFKDK